MEHLARAVRHHHERWDGMGYPDGLKEEDIPLESRLISIADSYSAITEKRRYKDVHTKNYAISQLIVGSGTQFDPSLIEIAIPKLATFKTNFSLSFSNYTDNDSNVS
jgi:response regulator RpfG family c-di-GMP phosphodiesterase